MSLTYENLIKLLGGAGSSNLDFCEDNFVVSNYIAEFVNSFSSLALTIGGLRLLYLARNEPHFRFEKFGGFYIGMILCGLNSFLYHATLTRIGQTLDEMSMCILILGLFTSLYNYSSKLVFHGSLFSYLVLFGLFYVYGFSATSYFNFFLPSFLLVVLVTLYSGYSVYTKVKSTLVRRLYIVGHVGYLIAYLLWIVDVVYCNRITKLFYLHSWFHLASAVFPQWLHMMSMYNYYDDQNLLPTVHMTVNDSSILWPIITVSGTNKKTTKKKS
jgi:dihydroceramidase